MRRDRGSNFLIVCRTITILYVADVKEIKIRNIETNIIFIWRNENIFQFRLSIFQQNKSSVFYYKRKNYFFFCQIKIKRKLKFWVKVRKLVPG